MNIRRSALILSAVATAAVAIPVGAAAAPSASGSSSVKVIANCETATSSPKAYILTCADANTQITHVKYSTETGETFGSRSVSGKGTYVYNTCTPNCAAGTYKHHPISFMLFRIKTVNGQKLYTRLEASYAGLSETFDLPTSAA